MRDRLTVLAFRGAWAVLPRVPEVVSHHVANALSDLAWIRNGRGVARLQGNLGLVTGLAADDPKLRALTRRAVRRYGRYWREMFTLSAWSEAEIDRRLRVDDKQLLDDALAEGNGVILAATHSGNWDLAGVWGGRVFGHATTVAERLKPEALFDEFVERRSKCGLEIVPHQGGPRAPFAVLTERLREGGLVALVSDRDLSSTGIEVQFFGRTARMAAGPAALARATGAVLLPVAMYVDGAQSVLQIHERMVIDQADSTETVTQRLADVFALDVAAHPEDWHMLQRVWIGAAR